MLCQALIRGIRMNHPQGRDCPQPLLPLLEGWAQPLALPTLMALVICFQPIIVCKLLAFILMFCSSPLKQSPSLSHGKGISKGVGVFPLFPLASSLCSVWQAGMPANK